MKIIDILKKLLDKKDMENKIPEPITNRDQLKMSIVVDVTRYLCLKEKCFDLHGKAFPECTYFKMGMCQKIKAAKNIFKMINSIDNIPAFYYHQNNA